MGIRERWRAFWGGQPTELEPDRRLDLRTGFNVRELGGYAVERGATSWRRFVRSGSLDMLSPQDQERLYAYGVRLVLDLRGDHEVSVAPDKIARMPGVRFLHVPLYDIDLSDPSLEAVRDDDFRTLGYLTMLANKDAIRRIFSFFATAEPQECVLFHCAAGMDRTGVTAMLLLGLAGASRERIVADYCYSFGSDAEVDASVFGGKAPKRRELELRLEAIRTVLDRLRDGYGTVENYLLSCDVTREQLESVRSHLLT
ncbi:MAG: tyrosine-protein phosphatase [Atopobiaceae bacterium]|nr:tyrosine-protein phosphatase [Atopobiaceae bacterium]